MSFLKSIRLAAVVSTFAIITALNAQSVTTVPVGFTTITVPANGTQAISIPLDNSPDFLGTIASRSGTTISVSGASWTASAYGPYETKPYVVRFLTGASQGRQLKVASNTSNSLAVVLPSGAADVASIAAVGDSFELLACDTLASFFGTGSSTSVLTNVNPSLADNVMVRGSIGWLTFYNDGSHWYQIAGDDSSQDAFALSPENGILFVRRGGSALSIMVSGQVPTTNLVTDFAGGGTTLFANRFPVDTTLSALGFQSLANWTKGANPTAVDNLWIKSTFGWNTYYHDGASWLQVAGDDTPQNPQVKAGSAILIVRKGTQPVSLNQPLPYTL